MKKIICVTMALFMIISQTVSASVLGDIYLEEKDAYSEIVQKLYKGGATDADIVSFFDDVEKEIIENYDSLNEENYEVAMQTSIETALKYSKNQTLYGALASQFATEAIYYLINGEIPESIKTLYNSMKDKILASETLKEYMAKTFLDEDDFLWAMNAINPLVKSGILKGYDDKTFKGNNSITRAEFTKIVVMAFVGNDTEAESNFSDVGKNEWYYSYISTAKNAGIISGYEDNTFRPNDIVTRQDMAVIIKNARFKNAIATIPSFTDLHEISNYASEAVAVLAEMGVIRGMGNGSFAPKNPATRAQAAQMIYNAMNVNSEE